jgi:hypothetical protein
LFATGGLKKATVPALKAYCEANDLKVPAKAKKEDFLLLVEKHLQES